MLSQKITSNLRFQHYSLSGFTRMAFRKHICRCQYLTVTESELPFLLRIEVRVVMDFVIKLHAVNQVNWWKLLYLHSVPWYQCFTADYLLHIFGSTSECLGLTLLAPISSRVMIKPLEWQMQRHPRSVAPFLDCFYNSFTLRYRPPQSMIWKKPTMFDVHHNNLISVILNCSHVQGAHDLCKQQCIFQYPILVFFAQISLNNVLTVQPPQRRSELITVLLVSVVYFFLGCGLFMC